jgi:glycerophosphodiester phosphodiesterase
MKFAHHLPRNQVPEWASSYINYKGLKKLIKNAAEASKNGVDPDLAGMLYHFQYIYPTAIVKGSLCPL